MLIDCTNFQRVSDLDKEALKFSIETLLKTSPKSSALEIRTAVSKT